ncbi:hypothetical protein EP331_15110 [bacterium]|nr:MAG: hypothetical protein EP331_15110 [bacterium]
MIRFLFLLAILYFSVRFFRRLLMGNRQTQRTNPFFSAFNQAQQRSNRIDDIEDAEYVEIKDDSNSNKE